MSAEFSRRSFLKYTALTAVAVAGSSILTGCSGEAPVKYEVGTSNRVLKVQSTLDKVEYNESSNTTAFHITIYNGRVNALKVAAENFAVRVDDYNYLAYMNDKITVDCPGALDAQLKNGQDRVVIVKAKGLNACEMAPVRLTYYPDVEYSEYSANWELDAEALKAALDDSSEDSGNTGDSGDTGDTDSTDETEE